MSDDRLFDRRCRLRIKIPDPNLLPPQAFGTSAIEEIVVGSDRRSVEAGLRVQFEINKTDKKDPNTSQVTVSNLSPDIRSKLARKGIKLELEAGYEGTGLQLLTRSDVRTVDEVVEGGTINSVFRLGDGERALRFGQVSESFGPGTGAGEIIKRLAKVSGLQVGNVPDVVADLLLTYEHGYVADGRWGREFDRIVKAVGYTWSVQDGTIQVLRPGDATNAKILLIQPSSGLIGSPETGTPEKKGGAAHLKWKALLRVVTIGGRVHIKAKKHDGVYVTKKLKYQGDTHGNDWYVHGESVVSK